MNRRLCAVGLAAALAVAAVLGRIAGRALGDAADNGSPVENESPQPGPEESRDG